MLFTRSLLLGQNLHAQADLSVCNGKDLYLYGLSFLENSSRMLDALGTDLRNMHKSVYALCQLHKSAVIL